MVAVLRKLRVRTAKEDEMEDRRLSQSEGIALRTVKSGEEGEQQH